jgi:hypothetical protein
MANFWVRNAAISASGMNHTIPAISATPSMISVFAK